MKNDIRMLPISQIKIGKRHRKALGDLAALAASIESGLLQPIGVTPEMDLIWGYRRLLAYRDIHKRDVIRPGSCRSSPSPRVSPTKTCSARISPPVSGSPSSRPSGGIAHGGDRKSDQRRICDVDRLTTRMQRRGSGFAETISSGRRRSSRQPRKTLRSLPIWLSDGPHRKGHRCVPATEDRPGVGEIRQEPKPLPQGPFRSE